MHYNQNAFKTQNTTKQAVRPKSILIYGEISANQSRPQLEMFKLTAALVDAGHTIETVAPTANPMVRNIVNFRTPHKYQHSTRFLTHYDHVVIFLETMSAPKFRSTNTWAKTKERARILKFVRHLQNAGRHITLIGTKLQRITAAGIARDHRSTQFDNINAAAKTYASIFGAQLPLLDISAAQNIVIEHASFRNSDGKFSAQKLHRYLKATQSTDTALNELCTLATIPTMYQTSLVKRLKKQPTPNGDFIQHTLPPYPVLDMALSLDPIQKIPTYAAHLLNVLHCNHPFDLKTTAGRSDAMLWYHGTAREKLSEFWVPPVTNCSVERAPNLVNSNITHIEKFLNNPKTEPHHSLDLNRLLHRRRYTYGPTGMAIFLALLCRIHLSSADRMNPWKSIQIANWFSQTPCAIAPGLRGFSHVTKPTQNPRFSSAVIGLPDQETGLGTNMRMSIQAFDNMKLCCENKNLDTGDTQRNLKYSTRKLYGNFALHHINADRIPMNIMTPQYAHRNDVYHIGYFLWETSRIPSAHPLGTAMVNEVWAPTKFVANLYRDAGAKVVTMVGKALPELDYLTQLATITRPDPNHFTIFSGFDFHSSVERKNPMSVVQAFQNAFPRTAYPEHRLILKTTPNTANHWGDPNNQMTQIRHATTQDLRITLIEKQLPLKQLFAMIARANCVVSAHRGEGFGYLPAYALALRKPTIVTNWGGVTDFCTPETAYPVEYKLVDVPQGHAIYDANGAQWADIDISDLSHQMLGIFNNPSIAKSRAQVGQALVNDLYSMERLTKTYKTRLSQIGLI